MENKKMKLITIPRGRVELHQFFRETGQLSCMKTVMVPVPGNDTESSIFLKFKGMGMLLKSIKY